MVYIVLTYLSYYWTVDSLAFGDWPADYHNIDTDSLLHQQVVTNEVDKLSEIRHLNDVKR